MAARHIGLTGGIGSGKSTVARLFAEHSIVTVDADDVARQVVEPGTVALAAIAEHFGAQSLNADGTLNRAALRARVFADAHERLWLESLLHPLIRAEIERQLNQADSPYALLVSPLLLETDQHRLVEQVIVVDVPEAVQIARTMSRDGTTRAQVEQIMAAQLPRDARRAKAHILIDNDRPLADVAADVARIHRDLMLTVTGPE